MLDIEVYRRKKKASEECDRELEEELALWEAEMLKLSDACLAHGFVPVLSDDGKYAFSGRCNAFCPGQHMECNTVCIKGDTVSLIGWDDDGDRAGFMSVKPDDLLRPDREEYFLALYEAVRREEEEKEARLEEERERALYERLKAKYGES